MEAFGKSRQEYLAKFLELPNGMPDYFNNSNTSKGARANRKKRISAVKPQK